MPLHLAQHTTGHVSLFSLCTLTKLWPRRQIHFWFTYAAFISFTQIRTSVLTRTHALSENTAKVSQDGEQLPLKHDRLCSQSAHWGVEL